MSKLKKLWDYEIDRELGPCCPYCYEPKRSKLSCCGEVHFEDAVEVKGEIWLKSEIKIVEIKPMQFPG